MNQALDHFLNCNDATCRIARTIVQGVLGVLVANLDTIMGYVGLDATSKTLVVALVMAVLTPIMAEIGKHVEMSEE